jgi:hypothetical protein
MSLSPPRIFRFRCSGRQQGIRRLFPWTCETGIERSALIGQIERVLPVTLVGHDVREEMGASSPESDIWTAVARASVVLT